MYSSEEEALSVGSKSDYECMHEHVASSSSDKSLSEVDEEALHEWEEQSTPLHLKIRRSVEHWTRALTALGKVN